MSSYRVSDYYTQTQGEQGGDILHSIFLFAFFISSIAWGVDGGRQRQRSFIPTTYKYTYIYEEHSNRQRFRGEGQGGQRMGEDALDTV